MKITSKQMRFANEYLIDFNKVRAAKAAGYKSANVVFQADKLLSQPDIKNYISKNNSRISDVTPERVIKELSRIAFANAADFARIVYDKPKTKGASSTPRIEYIPTDDLSADVKASIVCVKDTKDGIRIETADKFRALELLCKHFGLLSEKNETTMQLNISEDDKALLKKIGNRYELDNR